MGSERRQQSSSSSKPLGTGISHYQVKPSAIKKMTKEAAEKLYNGLLGLNAEDRRLLVIVQRFEELSKAFGFRFPRDEETYIPASIPSTSIKFPPTTSVPSDSEIGRGISNFHVTPDKIVNLDPKSAARLYSGLRTLKLEYQKLPLVMDRFFALSVSFGYAVPEALQVAIASTSTSSCSLSAQLGMLGSRYYSVAVNNTPLAPMIEDMVPQDLDDFLDLSDYINIYLHRSDPFISKNFAYPQSFAFLRLLCQRMGSQFEPQMRTDILESGQTRVLIYMQHLSPIVTIGEGYGDTHDVALQVAAGAVLSVLCFSLVIPFPLLRLSFLSSLKYADAVIYACRERILEFVNVFIADQNVSSFSDPVDYRFAPPNCVGALCQNIHRLRHYGIEYWNNRKIFETPGNIVIPTGTQVSELKADPFRFLASATLRYDFKPIVYRMPPFILDFSQVTSFSQFWLSDFDVLVGKQRTRTVPNAEYRHMLLFQNNPITKEMPFDRLVLLPYRDRFDNLSNRLMILPVTRSMSNFDIKLLSTVWNRRYVVEHKAVMALFGDGSREWQHKVTLSFDGIPYIFLGACEHHHVFKEAYNAAIRSILTQLVLMRIIPQELMLLLAHSNVECAPIWMNTLLHVCHTRFRIFEALIANDQFSSLAFINEATIGPEEPLYKISELFFHTLRCSGHTYWIGHKLIHVPNSDIIPGERLRNGFFEFAHTDKCLDWARNPVHFTDSDIEILPSTKTNEGLRVQSVFEVFNPNDATLYVSVPEIRKVAVVDKIDVPNAAIQEQLLLLNAVPVHSNQKSSNASNSKKDAFNIELFRTPVWDNTFADEYRKRINEDHKASFDSSKSVEISATAELVRALAYMMKCQIVTKLTCEEGTPGKRLFTCNMRFTAPYDWILNASYTSRSQEEVVSAAAWNIYRKFLQMGCVPPDLRKFVQGEKERLYFVLKEMRPLIFHFSAKLSTASIKERKDITKFASDLQTQMIEEWKSVEILLPSRLLSNRLLLKCPSIRCKVMNKDEETAANSESTEVFFVPFVNERGRPIDDLSKSTPGVKINQGLLKRRSFDSVGLPSKRVPPAKNVTPATSHQKVIQQTNQNVSIEKDATPNSDDEEDEYLD